MKKEKFDKFIIVSDVNSVDEIKSAADIESDIFAVVIKTDDEFEISSEYRDYLKNSGFITVLYSSDMSVFSADFIMQFDIRLAEKEYFITADIFKELDIERYTLLCGRTEAYRLSTCFSGRKNTDFKSRLVSITEGTDGVREFCTSLFKEKSNEEIRSIMECLTAARSGDISKVFAAESRNFYSMVSLKAGNK